LNLPGGHPEFAALKDTYVELQRKALSLDADAHPEQETARGNLRVQMANVSRRRDDALIVFQDPQIKKIAAAQHQTVLLWAREQVFRARSGQAYTTGGVSDPDLTMERYVNRLYFPYKCGDRLEAHGLYARPDLNGKPCTVRKPNATAGSRVQVVFDDDGLESATKQSVLVKLCNLRHLPLR